MSCIFCKIVAGELPSAKIYEDDTVLSFLDLFPASRGHTLIIPKRHSTDVLDMRPDDAGALFAAGRNIAETLVKAVQADGFNFHMCTGVTAGQTVFHTHLHIIPRYEGAERILGWKPGALGDADRDDILAAVRPLL